MAKKEIKNEEGAFTRFSVKHPAITGISVMVVICILLYNWDYVAAMGILIGGFLFVVALFAVPVMLMFALYKYLKK